MKIPSIKDLWFVVAQFGLFLIYLLPIKVFSFHNNAILQHVSFAVSLVGLFIILFGMIQLNKNLTPFPTPKEHGTLIKNRLFKFVRYPIYSGIILATLSYGFYQQSFWKVIIGLILWVLFFYKTKYEETQLIKSFPEYEEYRKHTNRFFPYM